MISLDKQYRTRDGRAVRLYATDGGCDEREIHGAIEVNGGWEAVVWLPSGRARFSGFNFNSHDLIEVTLADELREQIPWSALRPEIQWVVMDENGTWMGYQKHPFIDEENGEWDFGPAIKMPSVDPARWCETLVERPEDT